MNFINKVLKCPFPKGIFFNINRFLQTESMNCEPFLPKLVETQHFWIWQKNENIKSPSFNYVRQVDLPNISIPCPFIEPLLEKSIEAPSVPNSDITKEAVRMIVIRRKKMKKHKLKKLRKRLRFYRAKIRQKRELKKEKEFQAVLIQQCKDAQVFSAEEYVNERLGKLRELITGEDLKGQTLAEFLAKRNSVISPNK